MTAYVPSSVEGVIRTWEPTANLRTSGRRRRDAVLEQEWRNHATGETEWRDIPFVHNRED